MLYIYSSSRLTTIILKSFSHIISDTDKTKLIHIQTQLEYVDDLKRKIEWVW